VALTAISPGLHRWTSPHPDWRPGAAPGSPADWPREVGSVACEVPNALALIDPQLPAADAAALWRAIDALAARAGGRVHVLTTIGFHRRSRDRFVERYGATTSRARARLPDGVEAIPIRGFGETMFWLSGYGSLVCGDRLLGDGEGGLRVCPQSWLGYLRGRPTVDGLKAALRPLVLDLPVRSVLVSHGDPVLENGRAALTRALDGG
jgi:hypothetical protein